MLEVKQIFRNLFFFIVSTFFLNYGLYLRNNYLLNCQRFVENRKNSFKNKNYYYGSFDERHLLTSFFFNHTRMTGRFLCKNCFFWAVSISCWSLTVFMIETTTAITRNCIRYVFFASLAETTIVITFIQAIIVRYLNPFKFVIF